MKSEIPEKRKKTFEKKNETPRAVNKIPQEHNKRKETQISLLLSLSLSLVVVGRE